METTQKLTRIAALAAMVLISAASLTACDPTPIEPTLTPTPTATESPATPEPTPEETVAAPVPTTLTISGVGISVLDESNMSIVDIPFTTNGEVAATLLTEALGTTPTTTVWPGGNCRRAGTVYDFGGFELDAAGTITMAPPAAFSVAAHSATITGGVAVRGPAGVQVGQTEASVIATIPTSDDYGTWPLVLEYTGGAGFDATGVIGSNVGGVLTNILSPLYVFGDC